MRQPIDWDQVAELAETIKEQGLSFWEGAKQFGIPVWRLYELSRLQRSAGIGAGVAEGEEVLPVAFGRDADGDDPVVPHCGS